MEDEMKVMMVVEGNECALRIEPEDEEGRALLSAFGIKGAFQTRPGSAATPMALTPAQVGAFYEGTPVEID
jgi:hypothetical protein